MFFLYPVNRHQCNPIPIDGVKYSYELFHSPDKAGYDKRKFKWKISECAVCNSRHYYDKLDTGVIEFIPYGKEND